VDLFGLVYVFNKANTRIRFKNTNQP